MSYEYTLNFNSDESWEKIIHGIEKFSEINQVLCFSKGENLLLKDPAIRSSWNYDVSITKGGGCLKLAVVGWSETLFTVVKASIEGVSYFIVDDDTDEVISLEQVFRLR